MRAKEFILKEDILNEADWNKVKSAILGGVLSLSALGAPNLQAKDIASMSGEEIKQYVIQNSQVKNKQEILDVINMLGQDRKREQPPIAQPTATPVATPPATPAPVATPPATPTATPVATPAPVATPPATPTATSGAFSIKGVTWGMTKDQVNQTVGATPYDPMAKIGKSPGYGTPEFDAWMKQDRANRENDVDYKFTIAGINNWTLHFDGPGGGLSTISGVKSPGQVQDLLPLFTDKFGKPQLKQFKSRSNSGLELDDFTATWMLKDTVITLNKYFGQVDKGFVSITSKDAYNRKVERMKQNQDKAARDFE